MKLSYRNYLKNKVKQYFAEDHSIFQISTSLPKSCNWYVTPSIVYICTWETVSPFEISPCCTPSLSSSSTRLGCSQPSVMSLAYAGSISRTLDVICATFSLQKGANNIVASKMLGHNLFFIVIKYMKIIPTLKGQTQHLE